MTRSLRGLLVVLILAAGAAGAAASEARLFALGGDGSYLEDAAGPRSWYGGLVDHTGWAALEAGVFDQTSGYGRTGDGWRAAGPGGGGQVPLGGERRTAVGLWWHARTGAGDVGELGDDRLEDAWQLMIARDLGALTAGLSVRHLGTDRAGSAPDSLRRRAIRDDFGVGLRWEASPRAYFDLAGELVRLADKSTVGSAPVVDRSTTSSYGLRARGFLQAAADLVVTPLVEHARERRAWDGTGGPADRSWRLWRLGAGLTWLPDPDHLFLLAVDWRDGRRRDAADQAYGLDRRVFAVRAACEARVHALLSLRLASGFELVHQEPGAGAGTTDDHLVPLSAGLALHMGPADLEFALANQPPSRADGGREPWRRDPDTTWLSVGLNYWF